MQTRIHTGQRLFEELDYRESDGIEVSLLWNRSEDRVCLLVVDMKTDVSLELPVEGANALYAFHHPYAYAARHGVDFERADEAPVVR